MSDRGYFTTTLCLCWLTMTACSESNSAGSGPSRTDPAVVEARSQALERKQLARVPDEPAAVEGEVPADVMARIRQHLAQRTGAEPESFDVQRAEWHEWPSGAMGCPQPGMNYTQSPVRGYWIVLRHAGRDYDYRVAESGHFVMCEAMHLDQPPVK